MARLLVVAFHLAVSLRMIARCEDHINIHFFAECQIWVVKLYSSVRDDDRSTTTSHGHLGGSQPKHETMVLVVLGEVPGTQMAVVGLYRLGH